MPRRGTVRVLGSPLPTPADYVTVDRLLLSMRLCVPAPLLAQSVGQSPQEGTAGPKAASEQHPGCPSEQPCPWGQGLQISSGSLQSPSSQGGQQGTGCFEAPSFPGKH